jgi:hypothetical protein
MAEWEGGLLSMTGIEGRVHDCDTLGPYFEVEAPGEGRKLRSFSNSPAGRLW